MTRIEMQNAGEGRALAPAEPATLTEMGVAAVVKGLVEHQQADRFFDSNGGLGGWIGHAVRAGMVEATLVQSATGPRYLESTLGITPRGQAWHQSTLHSLPATWWGVWPAFPGPGN